MRPVEQLTAEPLDSPLEPMELGEGPLWLGGERVSWVDISAGRVFDGRVAEQAVQLAAVHEVGGDVGAAIPLPDGAGWILAADQGFARLALDGTATQLAQPELALHGRSVRMNDAKADPRGRLWAGSKAHDDTPGAGTLWRVDLDGDVTAVRSGFTITNGIGWSPDGATMYVIDSVPGVVWSHPYDLDSGGIGRASALIDAGWPPGAAPDGLCVDDDGALWIACWGGGVVQRHAPDGRLLARVAVAAGQPSSCCLAGDTLLITTAAMSLDPRQPGDGRLFACHVGAGVGAPAATPFRGALPEA
ncbi:MAG TPA: SMP-30/gluconolactonase/LRE family protein [Conexibacter sp.]|jgi:sugar lactone lactonase YvrE